MTILYGVDATLGLSYPNNIMPMLGRLGTLCCGGGGTQIRGKVPNKCITTKRRVPVLLLGRLHWEKEVGANAFFPAVKRFRNLTANLVSC
jgi:hypothetical protein